MKRKFFSLLMALLLLLQIPVLGSAAETVTPSAAVRAAYWTNNTAYLFSDFPGVEEPESAEVSLMRNNQVIATTRPQSLSNADGTAHYLLLVDRSLSMSGYRNQIFAFVKAALKTERTDLKISVGAFDGQYQLLETGLETYNDVRSTLWNVTCNREESDIGGAVAQALEYLGENPLTAGDVNNLVLITDGEAWYSSNPNTQSKKAAEAVQNVSAMMAAYPDVAVHTLCFGNWDAELYSVLSAGRGLHQTGKGTDAGKAMALYNDGLCVAAFPFPGLGAEAYLEDNLMFCMGTSLNSVGRVRNITVAAPSAPVVLPIVPDVPTEEATLPSEEPDVPTEETVDPTEETVDPTEETVDPTVPSEEDPAATVQEEVPDETDTAQTTAPETGTVDPADDPDPEKPGWILPVGIGAAAVVILAAVMLVLKKTRAPAGSVRMSVEVLSGRVVKLKKLYYLTDQILIGTDRSCHIVIEDPGAAPVNTRIFKQGQMIYIEDMDSPGGTYLGGMRLYSSNRLRSGDDVTIGTVTVRILF